MKLPYLSEMPSSRSMVDAFRGYNHNLRIGDGEFYDMQNLTSSHYPVLSPRGKHGVYKTGITPKAMIAKDALCYLDGTAFVMNEYRVDLELLPYDSASLLSMGAYVVILTKDQDGNPVDAKWINTKDLSEYGNIEADFSSVEGSTVSFELSKVDGEAYAAKVSATEPSDKNNGDIWLDTSTVPNCLKQYSSTSSMWISIATTYIRINATGIGKAFEKYDGVTISGIESAKLSDLNSSTIIWDKGDDYIIVTGILDERITQTKPITVKRQMPLMDHVIECGNRLWGCRYGVARNGEVVNEIYASKLGDFKNWNCFMGISTDSYAVSRGSDGMFTGAVNYFGQPLFFKEGCLHKVAGNVPANFTVMDLVCRGVQQGCDKSLAIVNETLFYKARNGICAYDGSLPQEVSAAFGDVAYKDAVGCAHGSKYYVSMKDNTEQVSLFVFDVSRGMWHKEDAMAVSSFCSSKGELYAIPEGGGKILTMFGGGAPDTAAVQWMAETGVLTTDMPDKKYIGRMNIRMALVPGSTVSFFAQYDSIGAWYPLGTVSGSSLRTFTFPIKPRRCDHFRLRIEGKGDAKIYSITKTIEQGSDI